MQNNSNKDNAHIIYSLILPVITSVIVFYYNQILGAISILGCGVLFFYLQRVRDDNQKAIQKYVDGVHSSFDSITKNLVKKGDMVVLVMPQDAAAPKDRIIKPQVMTIREIIDKGASAICTDLRNFENTIKSLNKIDLIITDSQAFKEVYEKKPNEVKLTSFSVLFSAFKGDLEYFVESANVLDGDIKNILIAEACSHPPIDEDIGSVKIPRLIKKTHPDINIDFARGNDPIAYEKYDLIIACGSCMFNRTHVLNRVAKAKEAGTPMTNYGIAIAKMNKILEKISLPE